MKTEEQKALDDLECAFSIAENERGLEAEDSRKALAVLIAEATRRGKVEALRDARLEAWIEMSKLLEGVVNKKMALFQIETLIKTINSRIQQYGKEE